MNGFDIRSHPDRFYETWSRRCKEDLYAVLSGTIHLPESVSPWLSQYTLPSEALPDAVVILTVSDSVHAPGLQLVTAGTASIRISPCSGASGTTSAMLTGVFWAEGLCLIAGHDQDSVRLRISSPTNTMLFMVPEENSHDFQLTPLFARSVAHVEYLRTSNRYALAFYAMVNSHLLFAMAETLRNQHACEAALREYDRVLRLDDEYYKAWRGKAFALRELDRRQEALVCAAKAIDINPDYALGWRTKGALLRDLGQHEEGLQCYERGLVIDPTDQVLWQNKINALTVLGRTTDVAETLNLFRERFPDRGHQPEGLPGS